ncbi:MAG: hypothetical protein V4850_06045 [Myxococcota bacterium]
MPPNDGENRKIPGDRLVSRILTRVRRRPRMGLSPDFYARFGMADPWTAPEFGGEEPAANDGMVFLSAQPYYAMMRRLAAARRRRERRDTAFQARHPGGAAIRAVARHWPGETAASLAVSRIARLALDEMTLPPSAAAPAPAAPVVLAQGGPSAAPAPYRRAGSTYTSRGANAWWSTPFIPARVFGGSAPVEDAFAPEGDAPPPVRSASKPVASAGAAPARRVSAAQHAGARLADAAARGGTAARAIAAAVPASLGTRHLARVVEAIESLPPEEQQVQIRRVIRRLGASAPIVRTVFEEGEVSATAGAPAARPAQIAARRADPTSTAGLRPVLARSPAMALASAPEVDRAASGTLATAERSAEASGSSASLARLPRRAAATQRALARGASVPAAGVSSVPAPLAYARAVTSAALTASPVQRPSPAGAGPRGRPSLAGPGARAQDIAVTSTESLPAKAAAFASRMPASARAVSRYAASALPAEILQAEAANGAVRTTQGTWVAAKSVISSQRDPSIRASVRHAPASAHAASRVDAGQVEGRSVLPRAIPAPDRVLAALPLPPAPSVVAALSASPVARAERTSLFAAPVAPTGSTPVRTEKGAWVAARSPEGRAALLVASARNDRADTTGSTRSVGTATGATGSIAASGDAGRSVPSGAGERRALGTRAPSESPVASARTLAPAAFRTAEPASVVSTLQSASGADAVPAARPAATRAATGAAWAQPAAARPSGVVHAAARAPAPSAPGARASLVQDAPLFTRAAPSGPAASISTASRRSLAAPTLSTLAPSSAGPAAGAAPASPREMSDTRSPGAADARGVRVAAMRASTMRAPAMAHASARTELPVEGATLQPQVSPSARPVRAATLPARARAPHAARPSSVAAASRIDGLLTTALSEGRASARPRSVSNRPESASPGSSSPGSSSPGSSNLSRFARSGPLSFALPPLTTGSADAASGASSARGPASAARGPVASTAAERSPARSRVRATRVFTTADSAYSPSSAVTTPSGVWISARAAAATPGLRILRTEGGRLVALAPAPEAATPGAARSATTRAPATAGASFARPFTAPTDDGADALIAPAPAARRRASDWAAERQRVGEATAYRGAYRTPEAVDPAAPVYASAEGERDTARPTRTPARRDRPRRIAATAGDMSLPTPMAAGASGGTVGSASGETRGRAPLDERLHGVAAGTPDGGSPSWAARSDGAPRVRSPGGLFEALARATSTEEIVRVIYARADGVRETPLAKEAPVVQVIEQIRQEVRREQAVTETATRASRLDAPSTTTIRGTYVQPVKSTTRVNRGGVRGVNATARSVSAGSGDDRIMKLVKKLQGLIHLAEAEGRLADARSQVRMAEDSAGARAEGQGPVGTSKDGGEKGQKQDIEALGREVLEVVTRELEFRRSRRVEDHDESSWW